MNENIEMTLGNAKKAERTIENVKKNNTPFYSYKMIAFFALIRVKNMYPILVDEVEADREKLLRGRPPLHVQQQTLRILGKIS